MPFALFSVTAVHARQHIVALAWILAVGVCATAVAERMHIVIPAGSGGGLDGTARETGRALVELGLVEQVSFENVSGGGGGRAMAYFLENADRFVLPVLVNSTPLVLRSLQGLFPFGFRDLTPVAALIGDHGVFVVRADSAIGRWDAVIETLRQQPGRMVIGGGSVRGSLDHVVLALALEAAELPVRAGRYVPYDGGGKAMLALLGGEVELLSTGLGESMAFVAAGEARVLAVTSATRIPALPDVPTLKELGYPVVFANWRGLFGSPTMPPEVRRELVDQLRAMRTSPHWEDVLGRRGWTSLEIDAEAFGAYLEAQETQLAGTMRNLGFLAPPDDGG
ncbi:MAG: tripartite tricarboxylate transporter substrate-binding protein [Gammaproteobacteria bacterium]|nr:tripartite tricarboxylate transporter substrate-binding protein [Gammaproteobacteria bacterium]